MIATTERRHASPHDPATYVQTLLVALTRWKDRLAFDQPGFQSYRYGQIADLTGRMIAAYRRLGIKPGSGIGIFTNNSAEAWIAGFAAQVNLGYYTALPARGGPDDLAYIAVDADLTAIVIHPDLAEQGAKLLERCPSIRHVLTLGPCDYGIDLLKLADEMGAQPDLTCDGSAPDDIGLLWYSGGTTGYPKGAVHTQAGILENAIRLMVGYELPLQNMRYLASAPISHSGYPFIAPTLISGGTVIIQKTYDPDAFLDLVAQKQVTLTMGVPTMLYGLMETARRRNLDVSSLQRYVYGGSPISAERLGEAVEIFGNIFTQMYGQAESLGAGTALLSSEHDASRPDRLASCGRAVPGVDIVLLDDSGQPVETGAVGEICLRARTVMQRYWKRPEMTEECLAGGWLHTGDLARLDQDGFYTIVDRKKDMIVSGGFNVFPAEIERLLATDPDVHMAAVIGVPDPKWGESVKALIVPKPGRTVDTEKLISLVREKKGAVHTPKSIEIVATLELTPAGKVNKKAIRAQYWGDATRNVN